MPSTSLSYIHRPPALSARPSPFFNVTIAIILLRAYGTFAASGRYSQSALSGYLLIPASPSDRHGLACASTARPCLPSGTYLIFKSQLLRAYGTFAASGRYSQSALSGYLLIPASPSDRHGLACASTARPCLPSGTFKAGTSGAGRICRACLRARCLPELHLHAHG